VTNQGPDLIGDFQRWLMRAGARGMSRELADQVRTAIGRNQPSGDVWETATSEPPPGEAPECAWCPLCRAARLVREAKPGRDTRVAAVGDALTTVVQDAVSVLEAALAATGRVTGANGRREDAGPGTRGFPAAGQATRAESGGKAGPAANAAQTQSAGKAAPAGSVREAASADPAGNAAQAESAGKAAPAGSGGKASPRGSGGKAAPAGSAGKAESAGKAAPRRSGGKASPAGSGGKAAPVGSGGQAAPAGRAGPAAQAAPEPSSGPDSGDPAAAAGERAAAESPEEPPHEPDDRG